MNKVISYTLTIVCILGLVVVNDALARGGRGGGGGGFSGGGGGRSAPSRSPSMSRPSPSRSSPSMSRPSTSRPSPSRPSTSPSRPSPSRPSTTPSRPSTGTRPGTPSSRPGNGTRPGTSPSRPSTGTRPGGTPSKGDLQNFLQIPGGSTGRPSTGQRPATGGGAAADFLNNSNKSINNNINANIAKPGARPGTADRPGVGNRPGNPGDRLAGNKPNRVENRGERQDNRSGRRDEVRDQFRDNHPRYDFWKDNPNWARWRWNRPYRWATYAAVSGFFSWGSQPVYYNYGENIYYEEDGVYYGDEQVATAEEYTEQAAELAESAPEVDDNAEWMTLGVFAITQDDQKSGPPPTLFLQLAVNKQGVIAGTFVNDATDKSQPVQGMVDMKTQRSAWTIEGAQWPIMETGITNLTEDTAGTLVHFEDGSTQQWLLVRMEEPEDQAATGN